MLQFVCGSMSFQGSLATSTSTDNSVAMRVLSASKDPATLSPQCSSFQTLAQRSSHVTDGTLKDVTRWCNSCRSHLPVEKFARALTRKSGFQSFCRSCMSARYGRHNPARQLKFRYRLNVQEYSEKLLKQQGLCAACGIMPPPGKGLELDHDHSCCNKEKTCGKCLRDFLCPPCNKILGHAKDNEHQLLALIHYLNKWKIDQTGRPDK